MALDPHPAEAITRLLHSIAEGDCTAREQLLELVHRNLKKIAQKHMEQEAVGHLLQPTALVNELYLRLFANGPLKASDRKHFYRLVSKVMRQVLLDDARRRHADIRGGGVAPVTLDEHDVAVGVSPETQLAMMQAIDRLAALDSQQAEMVELRYVTGLTVSEIAELYSVSERHVQRELLAGKMFIRRHLAQT